MEKEESAVEVVSNVGECGAEVGSRGTCGERGEGLDVSASCLPFPFTTSCNFPIRCLSMELNKRQDREFVFCIQSLYKEMRLRTPRMTWT